MFLKKQLAERTNSDELVGNRSQGELYNDRLYSQEFLLVHFLGICSNMSA